MCVCSPTTYALQAPGWVYELCDTSKIYVLYHTYVIEHVSVYCTVVLCVHEEDEKFRLVFTGHF